MKKIFASILMLLFLVIVVMAQTVRQKSVFSSGGPFDFYDQEICNDGTHTFDVPISRDFTTGLLIRLNIFDTPDDTLCRDTTKVMLSSRFSTPDASNMSEVKQSGYQAWVAFTDSFQAAAAGTTSAELWFPADSLMTGYDGMTLGDLLRFTFTITDTAYSNTNAWCDSLDQSLKFQIVLGYF